MLMILLMVLIVLALAGGGWGYKRYGWAAVSPGVVILLVVGILFVTGNLHLR